MTISRFPNAKQLLGDIVRFDAERDGQPVYVDIDLIQWTVICDRNPEVEHAIAVVESLTPRGVWRTGKGMPTVLVALGCQIVDGPAQAA